MHSWMFVSLPLLFGAHSFYLLLWYPILYVIYISFVCSLAVLIGRFAGKMHIASEYHYPHALWTECQANDGLSDGCAPVRIYTE